MILIKKSSLLKIVLSVVLLSAELSCEKPDSSNIIVPNNRVQSTQKLKKRVIYSYTHANNSSLVTSTIDISYDTLGRIFSFGPQGYMFYNVFYNKDTIAYAVGPIKRENQWYVLFSRASWIFEFDSDKKLSKVITQVFEAEDPKDLDVNNPAFGLLDNSHIYSCDSLVYSSNKCISEIWNFLPNDYHVSKFNYADINQKVPYEIIEYRGVDSIFSDFRPFYKFNLTFLDTKHPAHASLWFMGFMLDHPVPISPLLPMGDCGKYLILFDQPIRNFYFSDYAPPPHKFTYDSPNYKYAYSSDSLEYNCDQDPGGELAAKTQFKFKVFE